MHVYDQAVSGKCAHSAPGLVVVSVDAEIAEASAVGVIAAGTKTGTAFGATSVCCILDAIYASHIFTSLMDFSALKVQSKISIASSNST